MVNRRRAVAKVHVLPPDVVPMSEQDEQQAVAAIAAMIARWWREHGSDDRTAPMKPEHRCGS